MIYVTTELTIPESDYRFQTARSSGPGGQNVNTRSTAVTIFFAIALSKVLSDEQKSLLFARLGNRINSNGELHMTSQTARTQGGNKRLVQERFADLLRAALAPVRVRKPTRTPKAVHRKRLENKKRRSILKKERSKRYNYEYA